MPGFLHVVLACENWEQKLKRFLRTRVGNSQITSLTVFSIGYNHSEAIWTWNLQRPEACPSIMLLMAFSSSEMEEWAALLHSHHIDMFNKISKKFHTFSISEKPCYWLLFWVFNAHDFLSHVSNEGFKIRKKKIYLLGRDSLLQNQLSWPFVN